MLVHEVMTSPAITISADATLKEAASLLTENGITAMPVIDDRGELLGVVSEADLLIDSLIPDQRAHERPVEVPAGPTMTRVRQVMTTHAITIGPRHDLAEAADLMLSGVVKSLPVIEENRVIGILSRGDLVHLLAEHDQRIEATIGDLFRDSGYPWTVSVSDGVVSVDGPSAENEVDVARVLVSTVPGVVGVSFPAQRRPGQNHRA